MAFLASLALSYISIGSQRPTMNEPVAQYSILRMEAQTE